MKFKINRAPKSYNPDTIPPVEEEAPKVEDRPILDCSECGGTGLIGDPNLVTSHLCEKCGGTGK